MPVILPYKYKLREEDIAINVPPMIAPIISFGFHTTIKIINLLNLDHLNLYIYIYLICLYSSEEILFILV